MTVSFFVGDLTDAPVDALCTSTNPRLSLMMGTGGAVRDRGGYSILRECETIAARGALPPGSVHVTNAGLLPHKKIIHCVASDGAHVSSAETIRRCTRNALRAAAAAGCTTVAMPLFAAGHARFDPTEALLTMMDALREAPPEILHVYIVITDESRALLPDIPIEHAPPREVEDPSW